MWLGKYTKMFGLPYYFFNISSWTTWYKFVLNNIGATKAYTYKCFGGNNIVLIYKADPISLTKTERYYYLGFKRLLGRLWALSLMCLPCLTFPVQVVNFKLDLRRFYRLKHLSSSVTIEVLTDGYFQKLYYIFQKKNR